MLIYNQDNKKQWHKTKTIKQINVVDFFCKHRTRIIWFSLKIPLHIDTFHKQSTCNIHSYKLNLSSKKTSDYCSCVYYLLCWRINAAQHRYIGFGKPPLNPVEFSQPPVLLLLQNCDDIIFGEVEMAFRLCSPRAQSPSLNISHHLQHKV